jgi:hypothetical protein
METLYCTPEWLEECARVYHEKPFYQEAFKKLSVRIFYRVIADPSWGFDRDFIFGADLTRGVLNELRFYTEDETKAKAEFVMAATPQEWKLVLRREHKFLTDFMLGKIRLELGSKVGVLGIAPYADTFINLLNEIPLKFQDELNPQQLEDYREYTTVFRSKLGI